MCIKFETGNWCKMHDLEVLVDFAEQLFYNGFRRGVVMGAGAVGIGVIIGHALYRNRYKIRQCIHNHKVRKQKRD